MKLGAGGIHSARRRSIIDRDDYPSSLHWIVGASRRFSFRSGASPSAATTALEDHTGLSDFGRDTCARMPFALTVVPTSSGYTVTHGGTFDSTFDQGFRVTTAGTARVNGIALSFPFAMPGRTPRSTIAVESHGRILEDGALPDEEGFAPNVTVENLLNSPFAQIAPFWAFRSTSGRSRLYFRDDGTGTSASVTWLTAIGVGLDPDRTLQLRLFPDHSFQLIYQDLPHDVDFRQFVVGASSGFGVADPGESDLSSGPISVAGNVFYEEFGGLNQQDACDFDDTQSSLARLTVRPPQTGTVVHADITHSPGATAVVYLVGLTPSTTLNLGFFGAPLSPCELPFDLATGPILTAIGVPGVLTPVLDLTGVTSDQILPLSRLPVNLVALVVNPTAPASIIPTDELLLSIGNL